jgi:TRAP-type C4-dicarboxylate transport system permease small subunit
MASQDNMPQHTGWAARLEHGFVRLNQGVIIALMASMAVLVFTNVVMRYVFNQSIFWVEEFTQIQMIWVAYLGAGLALREGRHVAVDMLQDALPAPVRRFMRWCIALAMALFLLALIVLGVQIAVFTWEQETPALGLPTGLAYLGIPIGATAMLLHLLLFWRQFIARDFVHAEELEGEEAHA